MVKLSAFADEVQDDFLGQIKFLVREKVRYIELRFINGKNILELKDTELSLMKKIMNEYGIEVSAIGSPIGKICLDEPFEPHLDKFKHAIELALFFQAPFIRMFSYYAPEGKDIKNYRDEVMGRMFKKVAMLSDVDVIMVHENESRIYGQTAQRCVDIAKTINSPKLRLVYDPANFVWSEKIANNIDVCWPLMKPYVSHIHIKDWKIGADIGNMPGQGDGQIKELFFELAGMGYNGFITMEPHLKAGGQFGGVTGAKLFTQAIETTREIAARARLACE